MARRTDDLTVEESDAVAAAVPASATHVVVGGGVHGLSVAAALAGRLTTGPGAQPWSC